MAICVAISYRWTSNCGIRNKQWLCIFSNIDSPQRGWGHGKGVFYPDLKKVWLIFHVESRDLGDHFHHHRGCLEGIIPLLRLKLLVSKTCVCGEPSRRTWMRRNHGNSCLFHLTPSVGWWSRCSARENNTRSECQLQRAVCAGVEDKVLAGEVDKIVTGNVWRCTP